MVGVLMQIETSCLHLADNSRERENDMKWDVYVKKDYKWITKVEVKREK